MNQDRPGLILNLLWRTGAALTMDQIRTVLAERCDTQALVGTLEHMACNGRLVAESEGDDTRYRIAEDCIPPPVSSFEECEHRHRSRVEQLLRSVDASLAELLDVTKVAQSMETTSVTSLDYPR